MEHYTILETNLLLKFQVVHTIWHSIIEIGYAGLKISQSRLRARSPSTFLPAAPLKTRTTENENLSKKDLCDFFVDPSTNSPNPHRKDS